MNLIIEGKTERNPRVGDIIEFDRGSGGHSHYLLCESSEDGYFIMNISGEKSRIKYYSSIRELIKRQSNITNIYSTSQYELALKMITDKY